MADYISPITGYRQRLRRVTGQNAATVNTCSFCVGVSSSPNLGIVACSFAIRHISQSPVGKVSETGLARCVRWRFITFWLDAHEGYKISMLHVVLYFCDFYSVPSIECASLGVNSRNTHR